MSCGLCLQYLWFFRTARKKEILKAYRKLAAIWHPDKYDGDDKAKAEKKFIDIAAAKEVLTDKGLLIFHDLPIKLDLQIYFLKGHSHRFR